MQAISIGVYFLFLRLFLGLFYPCLMKHTFQVYTRIPENGNKVCQSEDVAFSKTTVSATVCCSLCQVNAACMIGVFYNSETRRCTGCTNIQPSLDDYQGTLYFQAVSTSTNPRLSTSAALTTAPVSVTTTQPTTTSIAPRTTSVAPTTSPTTTSVASTTTSTALTTTTLSSTIDPTSLTVTTPSTTTVESLTGVRLVGGNTSNEGRLELKHYYDENNWRGVQLNDGTWSWKATQVVCRQLGFHFGGSYHKANKPFPVNNYKSYKFVNITCVGNEATIFDCPVGKLRKWPYISNNLGITCFTYDVNLSGYGNIHLVYGDGDVQTTNGHIEISYNGQWSHVCGELMNKAPDVFCATISNGTLIADVSGEQSNSSVFGWTKNIDCLDDTAPHPFFCLNGGWRLEDCYTYVFLSCKTP